VLTLCSKRSSTKGRSSAELQRNPKPYLVPKQQSASFASRFSHVFSSPNLRIDAPGEKDCKLRRSHSATSMGLPKPSPISPLRLPSLSTYDTDGIAWSEAMHKSLRLLHFPIPPCHGTPNPCETKSDMASELSRGGEIGSTQSDSTVMVSPTSSPADANLPGQHQVEIRVQQPTSIESPRPSSSVRIGVRENTRPKTSKDAMRGTGEEDNDPRRSVHLHSMRISHHLRSGSLLSWDQLVDAPELPTAPSPLRIRTVSDQSQYSHAQRQLPRHERHTSSSGFTSNKVPSRWGKVVSNDRDVRLDVASSIYSSRPHSPLDSLSGSMANISQSTGHHIVSVPSIMKKSRRSRSFPSDHDATPRPVQRYGVDNITFDHSLTLESSRPITFGSLARKNSVANTKTSKFREEFSSSPPKKKLTPSSSIVKFLNPKRLSLRSQSEANIQPESPITATDGPFDTLLAPVERDRRQSRSLISLQAEQEALGKSKGANQVWDRALQAHQEEKASMFLHKGKDLAIPSSPFRERSGSTAARRNSAAIGPDHSSALEEVTQSPSPLSAPSFQYGQSPELPPIAKLRRRALEGHGGEEDHEGNPLAIFDNQQNASEVLGAWGRYPSHTRHDRTFSAGKVDRVESRDFALEAAIRFASAKDETHDEDLIDPTERIPSPILLPGEKRKKKKIGSGRMAKSNSMTFGKALMKNYAKMFRSQSTEFRHHGRGHRSSIASGGILEFPELELVPDVWADGQAKREIADRGRSALREKDSMATLRPRRNSSAPNLNDFSSLSGVNDSEHAQDQARVWSVYYDDCVPSFPRASTEAVYGAREVGMPRRSADDRRAPPHFYTSTSQMARHSRHPSQLSRMSTGSLHSARPSLRSSGNRDGLGDEKSITSVRRSTMDLISKFKEQEALEHERVLSLVKTESRRETFGIQAL